MKIRCICDNVIIDQTDNIATKGYVLTDQDYFKSGEDYPDNEIAQRDAERNVWKNAYECDNCGRICILNPGNILVWFKPEEPGYKGVLRGQGSF